MNLKGGISLARFFAEKSRIGDNTITLTDDDMRHVRSLRLKDSETFTVCDGHSTDYTCRLTGNGSNAIILSSDPTQGEPLEKVSIFSAFAKSDRTQYIVQKAVELGAYEIVLFPASRCVAKYDDKGLCGKLERWRKIALEAAKQCGRGIVPQVRAASSYETAIDEASAAPTPLYCYELESSLHLGDVLGKSAKIEIVSIVSGPEGGFEPWEAEYALSKGMEIITLGARILRCETAPVAVLAAVMYHTGNL